MNEPALSGRSVENYLSYFGCFACSLPIFVCMSLQVFLAALAQELGGIRDRHLGAAASNFEIQNYLSYFGCFAFSQELGGACERRCSRTSPKMTPKYINNSL